jgi:hypothetical protein
MVNVKPAAPSIAAEQANAHGCTLLGSWIGFNATGEAYWTSMANGMTASSGTYTIDVPSFDLTLGNTFPTAVRMTLPRGVWRKTGGNTIAFTVVSLIVDANGNPVWTAKLSGADTMEENCNRLYVTSTLEVFLADMNPFTDPPWFSLVINPHYGYRMRVDPQSN